MKLKSIMVLSENWELFDRRDLSSLVRAAQIAEKAGIDAVGISEHIVLGGAAGAGTRKHNPREFDAPGNQDPATPWPSSLMLLAAVAAATSRIGLCAGAIIPALRHPLHLAKDLATLDLLSKGRLTVWPTVSWHDQEYAALNVPFSKRGRIMDEHLEIWRTAWSTTPASFDGDFFRFSEIYVEPKPWRPEGPPLWITGDSLHAAALRRLVRYGSGFAPMSPLSAGDRAKIGEAFAAAGRDPTKLEYMGIIKGEFHNSSGIASIDDAMLNIYKQIDNGVNNFVFKPSQFIERLEELDELCVTVTGKLKLT